MKNIGIFTLEFTFETTTISRRNHKMDTINIVFISGLWSRAEQIFSSIETYLLKKNLNLHLLSLPGHEQDEEMRPFTLRENMESLQSRIANIPGRILIVGHSFGGRAAKYIAEENENVIGVISLCSSPMPGTFFSAKSFFTMFQNPDYIQRLFAGILSPPNFEDTCALTMKDLSAKKQQKIYQSMTEESGPLIRELAWSQFGFSTCTPHPEKVQCPIFEISAEDDQLCPPYFHQAIFNFYQNHGNQISHSVWPGTHMLPLGNHWRKLANFIHRQSVELSKTENVL